MKQEQIEKELYVIVLKALQDETDDPSEVASALAQALALTLKAVQDVTGEREYIKESARKTFNDILDML